MRCLVVAPLSGVPDALRPPTADDSGAFPFTDPNPDNLPKRFYPVAYP